MFHERYSSHEAGKNYSLDQEAQDIMDNREEEFIHAINEALTNGTPTPMNKTTDLIYQVALAIHVLSTTISALLEKTKPVYNTSIPADCITKATTLIEYAEGQKDVMMSVSSAFPVNFSHVIFDAYKI